MMTIPMDNGVDNPKREHVQRLLKQNAQLENKRRKAAQARIPSDPNAWQKMRENFQAIILEDHDFSEQHDIEFALWQLHYKRIEELRATYSASVAASMDSNSSQNGKDGPLRGGSDRVTKIRSQLKTFLTEATGFYLDLMLKIRAKCGLPLGYLSGGDSDGQIAMLQDGNRSVEFKKGLISCHRCFIYLGDLARYKGLYGDSDSKALDFATASSYYMQAISLWPSRGNPHHQLAILASYSGDELVSIYRYFRSLAAESPFVTARDNLIIAFEKNRQSYCQLFGGGTKPVSTMNGSTRTNPRGRSKGDTRLQTKDTRSERSLSKDTSCDLSMILKSFNVRFVRLNGILFTRTSLEIFGEVFSAVKSDFLELLSSGRDDKYNFGTEASDCRLAIVRLIAILIFSIHNVNRETENQSYTETLQRSVLLENAFSATFELLGLIIERCSSLNDLSTSYLLPGIMVFIEWLACNQDIAVGNRMEEKQASARLFFWNNCLRFLNKIMSFDEDEDESCFSSMIMSRYEEGDTDNRLALPEDFELRGFLPLLPAQTILDFSGKNSYGKKEINARIKRILAAGKALAANVVRLGDESLYFDSKLKKFIIGQEVNISFETPKLNGLEKENPVLKPLQVEEDEEEEDDEVIVFKPFMAVKKDDNIFTKQYSSEILTNNEVTEPKFSTLNAFYNTGSRSLEQQAIENGLTNLTFPMMSGPTLKPDYQNHSFSVPMSQNLVVPSKLDSIMYPVADNLPTKLSSVNALGLKKNPVSRPVRHIGPPPGFGSVPSKVMNESLSLKAENTGIITQMDDYRWLDGYNLQSVNRDFGFNGSVSTAGHAYHNTGSVGALNFPFPGWTGNNHLLTEELHQQPTVQKRHYQGQSLWEGNYET